MAGQLQLAQLPPFADILLAQFKGHAKAHVDAASPQDRGEGPANLGYEKVLAGLQLVSTLAAAQLFDALLAWRKASLKLTSTQQSDQITILRKRLAVEAVYLEATLQLVSKTSSSLSGSQAKALEDLVFDWVLHAEKFVDSRFMDLLKAREKVTKLCARIIGGLSYHHLPAITNRFIQELESRIRVDMPGARQEILLLCEGMQYVHLLLSTDDEVAEATDFLVKMHPLKHVAPVRKSQVQHAICEALTSILKRLVQERAPRRQSEDAEVPGLSVWHSTVHIMRAEIVTWIAKQSKHAAVGYPFVTMLLCLDDDITFNTSVDPQMDHLQRQFKDKLQRTQLLECIVLCTESYLRRNASKPGAEAATEVWLARSTKPVMSNLRKGSFQFHEQQDLLMELCCVVARHTPAYGIGVLLPEMLSIELSGWDALMIGLRALLTMLIAAPSWSKGNSQPTFQSDPWTREGSNSADLLNMLQSGQQPLQVYAPVQRQQPLIRSLGQILQNGHTLFGSFRLYNAGRTLAEGLQKDKLPGLPVFATALRCLPYMLPEPWDASRIAAELPGYTIHADAAVRQAATDVLRRSMKALPSHRNEILLGMASFLGRLSEDHLEAIRAAVTLMSTLVHEWLDSIEGGMHESSNQMQCKLAVARLEGCGLCFLCSPDVSIRRAAWDFLAAIRQLHVALTALSLEGAHEDAQHGLDESRGHIMDILEESDQALVQHCYWDFGRWSDLWRVWRPVGDDRPFRETPVSLADLMRRALTYEDSVRWGRCLTETVKIASIICPASAAEAYTEIVNRLHALMLRDSSGRIVQLTDATGDPLKADLSRTYVMVACACPEASARPGSTVKAKLGHRELFRLLLQNARIGPDAVQQAAILALGHCKQEYVGVLLEEMQSLGEDSSDRAKARGRPRREDVRITVAHVLRVLLDGMPPGALAAATKERARLVESATETLKFLNANPQEPLQDLLALRYCLCSIARCLALQFADVDSSAFTLHLRRMLFLAFSSWTEEGAIPGRHRGDVAKAVLAAKARVKDPDSARALEADLLEANEYLELNAAMGMAAMLLGPAFDVEARRQQGRVFSWIDRMLRGPHSHDSPAAAGTSFAGLGPSKAAVAASALLNMLRTNPDVLPVYVHQSYSAEPALARTYFRVLTEAYVAHHINVPPHQLLSLILCKIGDADKGVRDDALDLLITVSSRVWKDNGQAAACVRPGTPLLHGGLSQEAPAAAVIIGNLQDAYQDFQLRLSITLARDHPELSESLCMEMMMRQLEAPGSAQAHRQALACLAPWMDNLSFAARWEGNWSEQLLKSMYQVTWHHASAFPLETGQLWLTVAANKRNVIPILDFVITQSLQEAAELPDESDGTELERFSVGKQVAAHLSTVSSQHTMDHLMYEISQLLHESDDPSMSKALAERTGKVYEFHHPAPVPQRKRRSDTISEAHDRALSHYKASTSASISGSAAGHFRRVSDLLRSSRAGSELSNHSGGSFTSSLNDSAMLPDSMSQSPSFHREAGPLPAPSPVRRKVLTRPEMAICLISEILFGHKEDIREHLAALLHTLIIILDSMQPLLQQHAQQAVQNLVYSLTTQNLGQQQASPTQDGQAVVGRLIQYMQAVQGQQLWPSEDSSLSRPNPGSAAALQHLVESLLEVLTFEENIRGRWAAEAMRWMLQSSSRHLTARSHQVFRALQTEREAEACSTLLACLHKCLQPQAQKTSCHDAIEICSTLQGMVEAMPTSQLEAHPQLLLACLAALSTSSVHVFGILLKLLCEILERLDLSSASVETVLLACAPQQHSGQQQLPDGGHMGPNWQLGRFMSDGKPMLAVQQLLIKGLFKAETELATVQALTILARHMAQLPAGSVHDLVTCFPSCAGLSKQDASRSIFGDVNAQMALSISALLPWLCLQYKSGDFEGVIVDCIKAHAEACMAVGHAELARALPELDPDANEGMEAVLSRICSALADAFFPRYGKLILERLIDVLNCGPESQHAGSLQILQKILETPAMDKGRHYHILADPQLTYPMAAYLETDKGHQVLQVVGAAMKHVPEFLGNSRDDNLPSWPQAIDEPTAAANANESTDMLSRVVEEWRGHASAPSKLMPYLDVQA